MSDCNKTSENQYPGTFAWRLALKSTKLSDIGACPYFSLLSELLMICEQRPKAGANHHKWVMHGTKWCLIMEFCLFVVVCLYRIQWATLPRGSYNCTPQMTRVSEWLCYSYLGATGSRTQSSLRVQSLALHSAHSRDDCDVECHCLPSVLALVQGKVMHSLQQPQHTKYTVSDRSNRA